VKKTLRLRLAPLAELGADSALDYEVLDEKRAVLERGTAVPAALPRLPRTELVVAAPDVLLVEATVPPLSGARLRAALHSLAEPHLLSSVESVWVVAARSVLAVLDRVLFERALALLGRLKIAPASAMPEQLTLPLREGRWRLRLGPAYGCLRTGELAGIACSAPQGAEPPVEVRLALEQSAAARPQAIEAEGECDVEAWSTALGVPVVRVAPEARAEPPRLELLQYELAPHVLNWRAARLPLALAALCALTWIMGLNIDAWLMLREERALRAQISADFREAFPRVPVILDAPKQMRQGVAELRGAAGAADPRDFLPLAAGLARAFPGEADVVRRLEFRDRVLRVELEPRALDSATKRAVVLEQLAGAGLAASISENTLTVRAKGNGS
jgi:general secretion pathway protein L